MSDVVQVNMHEAKSQLSQLAERVWRGDKVVIAKAGKPYLDLLPHVDTPRARKPGRLKGKIRISTDFDKTPEDIIDGFEGSL
ncbi:type II toxin-antitoxin system prevent-host-death family antitoxin [Pseudomonas sp. B21-028]|jgi:antitoxin (DNA-binding transcriptional repressor) of toxin-antitoxin stability system|uniref:type II toxin-antitoxin system Phd/YefM family antitoxin n=1 Tax=Pseudomonas sp. B21-028 TaxID=2895480 RepID=UPI00215ECC61|nr:type II toxin-antitoxin system prevent-host-death family antitoxin [Pseudomonas sp. B21-028]UVL82767.1 type II toxin-antitoxin system prevent-host-death family antitoxin [Pseudomonas sp. B21-028]